MSSAFARHRSRSRRTAPFIGHSLPAPAQFHALEPRTLFAATPSPLYDFATDASPIAAGAPTAATIPALNSLPSAKAQLYLDFDGDVASDWDGYDVPATPAYDRDGNPASFSDAEITAIQQVWAAVAEKFSPFNLNVTTVKPTALADKVALRAVIGGDGEWTGDVFGGIAYVGAFFNGSANTIYVFPENLADGHPPYVAEAIAHEAGHAFGLEHQSLYDSAGNLIDEYHAGDGVIAPIMGASYGQRGIWWSGTTTSSTTLQNDLSILAGSKNGFGYRADDHGDSLLEPTPLSIVGNQGNGAGVIEKPADRDFFSFITASGNVTITASPAAFGAMLDLRLVLYAHDGTVIATQDSPLLGETISTFLPAGSYRVGLFSADDNPGDVGQFTLSATLVTPATTLPVPTDLAYTILPDDGGLLLAWTDNANGELGYHVQRSTDGGNTWLDYAVTAADATSFLDTAVSAGGVYRYRIYAFSDSAISPRSAAVGVALVPDVPANLATASITSRRVRLTWIGVPGATTYVIERGKGDGTTFKAIGLSTGPGFSDTGLSPGNTYRYRVRAANAGGFSDASGVIDATTLLEAGVPNAPTNFSVYRKNSTQIQLTWQDNSNDEIGFRIQWTAPKRSWETLGTVPADKTSIVLYLWRDDAEFRIAAYNKAGRSAYTADTPIAASKRAGALPLSQNPMFSKTLVRFDGIESLFGGEPSLL